MKPMKKSIFEFSYYKAYLRYWLDHQIGKGRGLQTAMAKHMGCQTAYVSQVLKDQANFSLEQADSLNSFLQHDKDESEFFLLLVEKERAGTKSLKQRFVSQIDKILQQRLVLKNRVDIKQSLGTEEQAIYYSSWYYAAIHVAVGVPGLNNKESLREYFSLNSEVINQALEFLCQVSLLQKQGDEYHTGVARLFLGNDSPMIKKHHNNWRLQAIQSMEQNLSKNLHLSTVVSLSQKDMLLVKEKLVNAIEEARATIRESKEESLCCLNLDFFELKK